LLTKSLGASNLKALIQKILWWQINIMLPWYQFEGTEQNM
jgi:hypothetical protein